jgi:hypothetical protein
MSTPILCVIQRRNRLALMLHCNAMRAADTPDFMLASTTSALAGGSYTARPSL